jgi:hypothetical protein
MIEGPVDTIAAVLQAMKAPGLVILVVLVIDRLWASYTFVRDGASFVAATQKALRGFVVDRTSGQSRAIVQGLLVQTVAVVVYLFTALFRESFLRKGS